MKNTILTLLFSLLALSLAAQTGLLGLSYGDSREEALENLAERGFAVDSADSSQVTLRPEEALENLAERELAVDRADSSQVTQSLGGFSSVKLMFGADGRLEEWAIAYGGKSDDYYLLEIEVVELLTALHGEEFEYLLEYESYYWELSENCYLFSSYDWNREVFWIEYGSD